MSSLKKISLKDIAEAAGVSTALVSFVLNGKKKEYRVGEETAQDVYKRQVYSIKTKLKNIDL